MNTHTTPTDLAELVRSAARTWPERTAWIFDATGLRLSFADVDSRSDALAGALAAHGAGQGDRIAVMLRNQPEFPLLWLAIAKLGAVLVPLNTSYRELDGTHVLAHSGASIAVTDTEFAELLHTIAGDTWLRHVLTVADLDGYSPPDTPSTVVSEQLANIQYTSGTTGAPKGCMLSHRYWTTVAHSLIDEFPAISRSDVLLTAQPFHYIDPQWNVALGLASGATLVVLDRFHPSAFWDKVRAYGVTWFYCLGLMPTLLLRAPESPDEREHNVRAVHASAIPRESHAELERRWGVLWFESFGMTETGSDIRMSPDDHDDTVGTGCIGRPIAEREAVILDDTGTPAPRGTLGELALRGVGLMRGYHRDPDATATAFRDGWFHTGDQARMNESGLIYYVGRTKDMIRRSGENISADEVERALSLHPAVSLAAVVAVPDELRGEEIAAHVVLTEDAAPQQHTPDTLAEFCARKLAYFKVPRYWSYHAALPMTPSERVAKGQLNGADPTAGCYDRKAGVWL